QAFMGRYDERLMADLKVAMRAGDTTRRDVIRYLRAALKNAQIARVQVLDLPEGAEAERSADRDRPLSDEEELAVLQRQVKQRQDAIEQFARGGRNDLVERESEQLAILREYLPAGLSQEEIDDLTRAVIAETGARGPQDMKLVMPALIARAGGRAESRALSESARRLLAAG
ncbi:MAG: GatB/YqeY domain-containing protein, partial [Thermomicrobiales bacterium]